MVVCVYHDIGIGEAAQMIIQLPGKEPNKYQKAKANLKFGMFIHFGVNTFADKEWTDGSIPAAAFNAAPNREGKLMQSDIDVLHAAARFLGIAKGEAKT